MDNWHAIRDAITEKASKYHELDLPYVTAVRVLDHCEPFDVTNALFGQEQYPVSFTEHIPPEPVHHQTSRIPNGAWASKDGPRYTRVSAVLVATQLSAWNISRAIIRLCHNPWAQTAYKPVLRQLSQAVPHPEETRMQFIDGKSTDVLFEL